MNQTYKKLLYSKIEKFLFDYNYSKIIFEDLDKQNKLLHPGEYGVFREKICDDIIKFTIPNKFNIGTGFIINSSDETSTQCDIIIYDHNNTPLIEDSLKTKFFPVETVVGIGEIKSTLSTKELTDALIKLANNKQMKKIQEKFCVNNPQKYNFDSKNDPHDTIFSFLICEDIKSFNQENIFEKINQAYDDKNIKYEDRHNAILILKQGVLTYSNQYNTLPKKISIGQKMYMPKFMDCNFENNFISNIKDHEHIIYLFSSLSNFLMNVNIYYPEPNAYTHNKT